jgi:hypothetical protein
MIVAKQVADFITIFRALLGIFLVWLGISQKKDALELAVWIMIIDWTSDFIDGKLARRSRVTYQTWIGDHDLEVDMTVSLGLLLFLLASDYIGPYLAISYLVIWGIIFIKLGIQSSLGMLFQAPIYGLFIWISLSDMPETGRLILVWIFLIIVFTWPQFPQKVIPNFLNGIRDVLKS